MKMWTYRDVLSPNETDDARDSGSAWTSGDGWQYSETTNGTNRMHDGPQNSCCLCELPFARNQSVVLRKGRKKKNKKTFLLPSMTCIAVFQQGIRTESLVLEESVSAVTLQGVPAFNRTQVMLGAAKVWFIPGSHLRCSASRCVSLFVALSLVSVFEDAGDQPNMLSWKGY